MSARLGLVTSVSPGCRTADITDNGLKAMCFDREILWTKTPEESTQTLRHLCACCFCENGNIAGCLRWASGA